MSIEKTCDDHLEVSTILSVTTIWVRYPLLHVHSLTASLSGGGIFTKLRLMNGRYQLLPWISKNQEINPFWISWVSSNAFCASEHYSSTSALRWQCTETFWIFPTIYSLHTSMSFLWEYSPRAIPQNTLYVTCTVNSNLRCCFAYAFIWVWYFNQKLYIFWFFVLHTYI